MGNVIMVWIPTCEGLTMLGLTNLGLLLP